jgi:hypothetical protein
MTAVGFLRMMKRSQERMKREQYVVSHSFIDHMLYLQSACHMQLKDAALLNITLLSRTLLFDISKNVIS